MTAEELLKLLLDIPAKDRPYLRIYAAESRPDLVQPRGWNHEIIGTERESDIVLTLFFPVERP